MSDIHVYRSPEGRGMRQSEWSLETFEIDIERGVAYVNEVPVEGEYHHPVEFGSRLYPEHVQAQWSRISDGLEVVIEVRTSSEDGPIAMAYSVTPPNGVRDDADDRLAIRTMAKKAARSHGLGVEPEPVRRQYQLRDPQKQRERLEDVARLWHEHKVKKAAGSKGPVWEYIARRLPRLVDQPDHTGRLSKGRVHHLIGEAEKAEILDKTKRASE